MIDGRLFLIECIKMLKILTKSKSTNKTITIFEKKEKQIKPTENQKQLVGKH